ncbi:MAG TPA: hypothetical protein VFC59_01050, partial [Cryobacterium sp.]|nr:hypothetical protein [Cryobacterium sp.]
MPVLRIAVAINAYASFGTRSDVGPRVVTALVAADDHEHVDPSVDPGADFPAQQIDVDLAQPDHVMAGRDQRRDNPRADIAARSKGRIRVDGDGDAENGHRHSG